MDTVKGLFKELMRQSFEAGENYKQDWILEQSGEKEEIEEPNFEEFFNNLKYE